MKNTKKTRTIVYNAKKQILKDARLLYPSPKYKVTTEINTVYVNRVFKDNTIETVAVFDIDAW